HWDDGEFVDDDEYVEYVVNWDDPEPRPAAPAGVGQEAVVDTDVLDPAAEPLREDSGKAAAGSEPEAPHQEWRSILDQLLEDSPDVLKVKPIRFVHNGFHADGDELGTRGRHARESD
ncbi:MAG: MFS transporter, partial [Mycobacterium sp.]